MKRPANRPPRPSPPRPAPARQAALRQGPGEPAAGRPVLRRTLLFGIPAIVALAAGAGFFFMLRGLRRGTFNPHGVPSPLVGHRIPPFSLPGIDAGGFSSTEIFAAGRPLVINFFASWCIPCREEQPVLMALQAQGIPIWGIAYKDTTPAASAFLHKFGNPYARTASDAPGRASIDWGLTGVPETFIVNNKGVVVWHMAGPLTRRLATEVVEPMMRKLSQ
ncbi:MAG: DsbE family thiol:disulfide interchange protein [Rhodospirillales bacterium]|nr:DsbE family thiol:disulfide interchange protein [Rhodospirillales bacterium]